MKLAQSTLDILKNFSSINDNLVVKQGSTISTISEAKNTIGIAKLTDSFPQEFGIYSLSEMLGIHNLVGNEPELAFSDSAVQFSSGRSKANFRFADITILTTPKSEVKMPAADLTITITAEDIVQVRKAASTLGHSIVSIKGNDGLISLSVMDPKNSSTNSFDIILEENNVQKASFDCQLLIGNLKVLPGSYEVNISSRLISHWTNIDSPAGTSLEYYIALEKTSTFVL